MSCQKIGSDACLGTLTRFVHYIDMIMAVSMTIEDVGNAAHPCELQCGWEKGDFVMAGLRRLLHFYRAILTQSFSQDSRLGKII